MGYCVKIVREHGTTTWLRRGKEVLSAVVATWYPHPNSAAVAAKAYEKKCASKAVKCIVVSSKEAI